MPAPPQLLRNARLLAQAGVQHLSDDPALLAIQMSRRLPVGARRRVGRMLQVTGENVPKGIGLSALGAFMAGDEERALHDLASAAGRPTPMAGEVAVLLDRADLLPDDVSANTRARALWSRGDLTGAVQILEAAGRSTVPQAQRFRSELQMLSPGFRLSPANRCIDPARHADDEQLRVLHLVTNSLPHTQSGYSFRTHNILTTLADYGIESLALTRTGYPVMIGRPLCEDEDVIDGIRYRRSLPTVLGTTPEERLDQEVEEAIRIVERFRPHVLHATSDYRNGLVAQAVSVATGIPWVFEVRGLMEQTWIAAHRSGQSRLLAAGSEKVRRIVDTESSLAREADAVVTLSRTMAEVLHARGVPEERITLVPNGVDASLLLENLTPGQARAELGIDLPEGALVVGAVSALVDYEGFDVLLRAIARILSDDRVPHSIRDSLHVILVGDGVSAPALRDLAEELGLGMRLHMPGRVPGPTARTYVQALDIVVIPRKDLEVTRTVTPQKPAEALALGRPVVISDLPALKETVRNVDGDLIGVLSPADEPAELGTAICDLLMDPDRRVELSRRGREAAAERTWLALMRRYDRIYRSVCAGRSRGEK